uniref:Uncharacterized protein n=1 Tax=Mycena chlorophos TaxID=658473 RepID=A0ABQ0L1Q4_MYCCL|nr:predicted protein [Mycena chlorophos]
MDEASQGPNEAGLRSSNTATPQAIAEYAQAPAGQPGSGVPEDANERTILNASWPGGFGNETPAADLAAEDLWLSCLPADARRAFLGTAALGIPTPSGTDVSPPFANSPDAALLSFDALVSPSNELASPSWSLWPPMHSRIASSNDVHGASASPTTHSSFPSSLTVPVSADLNPALFRLPPSLTPNSFEISNGSQIFSPSPIVAAPNKPRSKIMLRCVSMAVNDAVLRNFFLTHNDHQHILRYLQSILQSGDELASHIHRFHRQSNILQTHAKASLRFPPQLFYDPETNQSYTPLQLKDFEHKVMQQLLHGCAFLWESQLVDPSQTALVVDTNRPHPALLELMRMLADSEQLNCPRNLVGFPSSAFGALCGPLLYRSLEKVFSGIAPELSEQRVGGIYRPAACLTKSPRSPMTDTNPPSTPSPLPTLTPEQHRFIEDIRCSLGFSTSPLSEISNLHPPNGLKRKAVPPRNASLRGPYEQIVDAAKFTPRGADTYWDMRRILEYGCIKCFEENGYQRLEQIHENERAMYHADIFSKIFATCRIDIMPLLKYLYIESKTSPALWRILGTRLVGAAREARTQDTNTFKTNLRILLPVPTTDFFYPPLELGESKSRRGLNHPQLRMLIMPWKERTYFPPLVYGKPSDPPPALSDEAKAITQRIVANKYEPSSKRFPSFCYREGDWDPNSYQRNLFRNQFIVRGLRLLMVTRTNAGHAAGERDLSTGCLAAIHNLFHVTPHLVAYIVVQIRVSISSVPEWQTCPTGVSRRWIGSRNAHSGRALATKTTTTRMIQATVKTRRRFNAVVEVLRPASPSNLVLGLAIHLLSYLQLWRHPQLLLSTVPFLTLYQTIYPHVLSTRDTLPSLANYILSYSINGMPCCFPFSEHRSRSSAL